MKTISKFCLFLIFSLYLTILRGAIGCKKIEHTVNYWNVSKPQFVKCSCACNNITPDYRGQCTQCGHYGRPDRGEISRRVLAEHEIVYR